MKIKDYAVTSAVAGRRGRAVGCLADGRCGSGGRRYSRCPNPPDRRLRGSGVPSAVGKGPAATGGRPSGSQLQTPVGPRNSRRSTRCTSPGSGHATRPATTLPPIWRRSPSRPTRSPRPAALPIIPSCTLKAPSTPRPRPLTSSSGRAAAASPAPRSRGNGACRRARVQPPSRRQQLVGGGARLQRQLRARQRRPGLPGRLQEPPGVGAVECQLGGGPPGTAGSRPCASVRCRSILPPLLLSTSTALPWRATCATASSNNCATKPSCPGRDHRHPR